jgi:bacterioferritin
MEDMFNRDVQLEQGAIKKYKEHIAAIDDPKIKKLLTKILMEEEEHLEAFQKMITEM